MNAYRENGNPATPNSEGGHDYAAVANRRPSIGSWLSLWAFLTYVLSRVLAPLMAVDEGISIAVAAVAAFTIVWPIWAKLVSEPRSATELYERELEAKIEAAGKRAISRAAPRRSIARGGRT